MRENSRQTIADMLQKTLDPGHAGSDALFVVSTSIGVSILGEAAYGRYVDAHPGATPLKDLNDPGEVYLPSGLVQGMRAKIDRMALVAASSGNALAPCRQLYAHRLQSLLGPIDASEFAGCQDPTGKPLSFASACKNGSAFCLAPGIVELSPQDGSGIDVLVVSDDNDTLQALRTELRPDQPEVDGILGTNALRAAEIDVDYPHDRLLARCPGAGCITRPELAAAGDRCQINHCIKGQAAFRNQAPAGASPSDPHLPGCP
ncbi:MAG TPA: hypothetical protein VFT22_14490, partial [Kofleriaceae bacterium]|nr:hypothetical protein [Kofleriaceae bacterium]